MILIGFRKKVNCTEVKFLSDKSNTCTLHMFIAYIGIKPGLAHAIGLENIIISLKTIFRAKHYLRDHFAAKPNLKPDQLFVSGECKGEN